jgi:hypothetical protein
MKTITIPRRRNPPDLNSTELPFFQDLFAFLLTTLIERPRGAIYAIWDRVEGESIWIYSEQRDIFLETPARTTVLVRRRGLAEFRAVLARLGFETVGMPYLGAGYFDIAFSHAPNPCARVAVIFSNGPTGFGAKLLVSAENPATETVGNQWHDGASPI